MTDIDRMSISSLQVYTPECGKISPSLNLSHTHAHIQFMHSMLLPVTTFTAGSPPGSFFVYNPRLDWETNALPRAVCAMTLMAVALPACCRASTGKSVERARQPNKLLFD